MGKDRMMEIRIRGLRTLENVTLKLQGLTAFIGDNASGKSTIVEACELLRKAAGYGFFKELYDIHGGLNLLLRQGSSSLSLGISIRSDLEIMDYDFTLAQDGSYSVIDRELLRVGPLQKAEAKAEGALVIDRNRSGAKVIDPSTGKDVKPGMFSPEQLVLSSYGSADRPGHIARIQDALAGIEVYLPFSVQPMWVGRERQRTPDTRTPDSVSRIERLGRLGANLANAYSILRNNPPKRWEETMSYIQLGLGNEVEDVFTKPAGVGQIELWVKYRYLPNEVSVYGLSDGTLSYLGIVALFQLMGDASSLIVFDEPDLHLHPHLLIRAVDLFVEINEKAPVILATHSDRLLDALPDPAESAVLCELDKERGATQLVTPDRKALERWLEKYRGLGDIRSAGHEASVMKRRMGE